MLQQLDSIRRALELPPDTIGSVIALHTLVLRDVLVEREQKRYEQQMSRLPMKIQSRDAEYNPMRIRRGEVKPVITRPQWAAFRIDEIEIEGDPAHWIVHRIVVGNTEQRIAGNAPWSGGLFRKGGPMSGIKLETLQTAMDFVLEVEYIGPSQDGAVFEATAVGIAV